MPRVDDISSLFAARSAHVNGAPVAGASSPLVLGELLEFNNATGQNRVRVNNTDITDVPVISSQLALSLRGGQTVLVGRVNHQPIILGAPGVQAGALEVLGGEISYVNGPTPPIPSAPTVTATFLGLIVGWDGTFADGAVITPDWSRVEVHVSDTSGFGPSPATFRSSFTSTEGGETTLAFAPDTPERFVRLVSRSLTGNASGPSVEASGVPGTADDFVGAVGSGTTIFSAPLASPPTATGVGDWWYTTDTAQSFRWDGATWVEIDLPGVAEALAEAIAAQQLADEKTEWIRSATEPPAPAAGTKVIWVDTANGNQLKEWDGDSWELFQFGTGAFQPGSIVASVIIATGTITGSLIEAQAITGDKIAAGSITAEDAVFAEAAIADADIGDLNAGKITSGTIGADLIMSRTLKTAAAGARSQMDITGFRVLNNAEAETIAVTANNEASTSTELLLPGADGDMVWTPDHASLDITGDIDLRCRVAMDNWLPGTSQFFIGKMDGGQSSYGFLMDGSTNRLRITWSTDGTNALSLVANAATGFADGTVHWVRVTLDVVNGANKTATFYTSEDGSVWTTLGTAVSSPGNTSIFAGTIPLAVGAREGTTGTVALAGKVWAAEVRNGIAGTVVANPVFTTQTAGATSFADSTGKTWTMNNNAMLMAQPGAGGVPQIKVRNPTGNATITMKPASDDLGDISVLDFVPRDLAGAAWYPARIAASIDNTTPADDRPVLRIGGPIDTNRGSVYPTIAWYGKGLVNPNTRVNVFADKIAMVGQLECTSSSMDTLEVTESTTLNGIVNTTWNAGSPVCGIAFVASMSGKVCITITGDLRQATSAGTIWMSFQLREGNTVGSGTVVTGWDPDVNNALRFQVTAADHRHAASYERMVFGLTAGADYNVRTMHQVSAASSGQIVYRRILIKPQLG